MVPESIKHKYFGVKSIGWLAQLVEHLVYTEGVKGSFPLLILTNPKYNLAIAHSKHNSFRLTKGKL